MRIKYNIDWLIRKTIAEKDPNYVVENIFDYQNVIRKRPHLDREIYGSNYCYGMNYILKRHSGYKKRIKCLIEHAPGLTKTGITEFKSNIFNTLLVASKQRIDFLKDYTDKKMIDIGPSIAYAENIYDDYTLSAIKKNLGKTLIVYPIHNIKDTDWESDKEAFINNVKEIVKEHKFDTVLVSLFYIDIQRGLHLRYEKEGWQIVSAGHMVNYDFNDCMKTIISLADMAVFQGFTSAIDYTIYMGVPSLLLPFDYNAPYFKECYRTDVLWDFDKLFNVYNEEISEEQKDICNYYFGYDSVKKPEELYSIFKSLEKNKPGRD